MEQALNIEHRLTEVEDRSKSNTKRLDKLEDVTNEIHTMSNTMVKLVERIDVTNKKVDKISSKVECMEKEPVDDYKHIKRTIVTAVITGVLSAIIGAIIGLIL